MRIAIVTPVFPPYRGGIGTLAECDAAQLAALGHEVRVYAPGAVPAMMPSGYRLESLHPWLRYGNGAFVPGLAAVWRWCDLALLEYPFFGGAEPLILSKPRRKKLLVAYHMDLVGSGVLGAIFNGNRAAVMPLLLRRADRVLLTSLDYAESGDLARSGLDRSLWRQLSPSVDSRHFSPGRVEARRRLGFAELQPLVLFVGGLDRAHYFKGVPALLQAVADPLLKKARLVIVGDGDLRAGYQEKAAVLGLADRISFVGSIEHASLVDYYRAADVLAFPSVDRSEAFGMVALEAMACGTPVVASDLPGVRTIVRHGQTGYTVKVGDVGGLARSLAKVLDDPEVRETLSFNARRLVESGYDDTARIAAWRAIISEVS